MILTAREDAVGAEQDSVGLVVVLPIVGVAHPGRKTLLGANIKGATWTPRIGSLGDPNPRTSRRRPMTDRLGSAFTSRGASMTETTKKAESTTKSENTDKAVDVAHRAADLSDEVLKSVESGQRAAIEAVRKFVDTVDEAIPAHGDRPSGRETVIDAALDMADRLVTTQYEFLRSVVRSADRTLRKPDDAQQ